MSKRIILDTIFGVTIPEVPPSRIHESFALAPNLTHLQKTLVEVFRDLSKLHDDPYKQAAFLKAARILNRMPKATFSKHFKNDSWIDVPGIGKGIHNRIIEFIDTGRLKEHTKLAKEKRKKIKLKPVSKKSKIRRSRIKPLVTYILRVLKPHSLWIMPVGSWRRGKSLLGDLEFLATGISTDTIHKVLDRSRRVRILQVMWKGKQKLALHVQTDEVRSLQLEFKVTKRKYLGGALLESTGSAEFNIFMRRLAKEKGFKLNHQGLWKDGKLLSGAREDKIFKLLGLPYIPPEDREVPPELPSKIHSYVQVLIDPHPILWILEGAAELLNKGSQVKKILEEKKFDLYVLRKEIVEGLGPGEEIEWEMAYTHDGDYIGDKKIAKFLCDKLGIKPELRSPSDSVCSIGYSEKDGKWYGWSHRAIVGFQKGDRIFEEEYGDENTPFLKHGRKPIRTLEDAKQSAINFAESVS